MVYEPYSTCGRAADAAGSQPFLTLSSPASTIYFTPLANSSAGKAWPEVSTQHGQSLVRHVTTQRGACYLDVWTRGSGSLALWALSDVERRDWLDSTGPDLDLAAPAAYQLENRTLELELGGDAPHHHHQRCSRSGTAVQTVGMGMQRNAAGGPHGRMGVVLSTFRYGCSWLPVDDGGWGPPGASRRHQPGNATLAPAVVTNRSRPRRCDFSGFVTVGCNMVTRMEFRRPLQLSPAKGYIYGRAAQSLLRDRSACQK
ncbi:hypothetical protein CMUS01_01143 [Colletotrichum musicola]|uniref:Uncharacterized protein n=1 Tax=Colletotrichum musicola TaxID=2175873 RepID=A0A8H6NXG0_9PEZI|nr:hypothetical protein CMUS01_01143 [Colletotrichum musicola]